MSEVDKPVNDRVIIRDLRIEAIVGLYPWERVARQQLLLDIDLATDIRAAAESDDLQYTIDYSAVCAKVESLVQQEGFRLIETLAERAVEMILREFDVPRVRLVVYKLDVMTQVKRVGIEIERMRSM